MKSLTLIERKDINKKNFLFVVLLLRKGVPYMIGKLKRGAFQQAKEYANWIFG